MDKQLNELYTALSELSSAVQGVVAHCEKTGTTTLTGELLSAQQTAKVIERRYRWISEGANESVVMDAAEADEPQGRYVAHEFQPGNTMFDQGMEDHCWILFDNERGEDVAGEGVLEHVAKERAAEWNALHEVGHSTLEVEFTATGDMHQKARMYKVTVAGLDVGTLYWDWTEGIRGVVRGGHSWEFAPSEAVEEAYKDHDSVLWFIPSKGWRTQKEACECFQHCMDEPLKKAGASDPWWVQNVHCFLRLILAHRSS